MSHQLSGEIKLVAVKIKLKRMGSIRNPQYRVVIADARTARDGRAIEEIGLYHPKEEPSLIKINSDRVQYWLGVGAQPTEPVMVLLKITGDWQKFKGLPGAEGTLRVKEAKVDKNTKFAETVAAVANEPRTPTIRPKVEKPVEEVKVEEVAAAPSEEVAAEVSTEATAEAVIENVEEVVEETVEAIAEDAAEAVAEEA
ncbi:30S ribosomal protein S16 [freshwater metagenome]|jgi:small subunit ribosomal protein S16|uniref:30S ribosomal protein S16 n=1 Tax=freshwater metagenome TaxID=449393 RepID=A0A094SGY2_9ZZZZ